MYFQQLAYVHRPSLPTERTIISCAFLSLFSLISTTIQRWWVGRQQVASSGALLLEFLSSRENFVAGAWDIASGKQSRHVVSEYGGPNDYFVELQV